MTASDPLSHRVLGAALSVHRALGPGLLESVYSRCLSFEFEHCGLSFRREVPIPVLYRGHHLDVSYRADFIVEDALLIEVKSVQKVDPIHRAQLLTYLKLTGLKTGLLLNFNSAMLRTGTHRLVL